jgi:hypothetical protein
VEQSLIKWNLANWITVVLMVAVMTAFVGFAMNALKGVIPGTAAKAAS